MPFDEISGFANLRPRKRLVTKIWDANSSSPVVSAMSCSCIVAADLCPCGEMPSGSPVLSTALHHSVLRRAHSIAAGLEDWLWWSPSWEACAGALLQGYFGENKTISLDTCEHHRGNSWKNWKEGHPRRSRMSFLMVRGEDYLVIGFEQKYSQATLWNSVTPDSSFRVGVLFIYLFALRQKDSPALKHHSGNLEKRTGIWRTENVTISLILQQWNCFVTWKNSRILIKIKTSHKLTWVKFTWSYAATGERPVSKGHLQCSIQ